MEQTQRVDGTGLGSHRVSWESSGESETHWAAGLPADGSDLGAGFAACALGGLARHWAAAGEVVSLAMRFLSMHL